MGKKYKPPSKWSMFKHGNISRVQRLIQMHSKKEESDYQTVGGF